MFWGSLYQENGQEAQGVKGAWGEAEGDICNIKEDLLLQQTSQRLNERRSKLVEDHDSFVSG